MKQSEFEGLQQIQAGNFPKALFADIFSLPKDSWHIPDADIQFATADRIMQLLRTNDCTVVDILLRIDRKLYSLYSKAGVLVVPTEAWIDGCTVLNNGYTEEVRLIIYYTQHLDFRLIQKINAPIDLLNSDQRHAIHMTVTITKGSEV